MLAYIKKIIYLCKVKLKNSDLNMESLTSLRKQIGVSYMGATKHSAKMKYSYQNGTETYCLYLAPADMSGYNVCPNSKYCKALCLNNAGHNKADILSRGNENSKINLSRIKKTRLFYENRDLFMRTIIAEIVKAKHHADTNNLHFAIRLNGTSDLSPEQFIYEGENILQIFSDVQFYDYTKVPSRFNLINKYPNYDLTFSYNGYNWNTCNNFLQMGGKVAVVFENNLPQFFHGYKVIDANGYDMRFLDPKGTIMGLHYHRTANDYVSGKYVKPTTKFIVDENDINCVW